MEEEEEEILAWAKQYAAKHHWVMNPDQKKLELVIRGLARNRKKFGEAYCPCRLRTGDTEEDAAIICPCIHHEDEIAREGSCHCRLYFRDDAPGGD